MLYKKMIDGINQLKYSAHLSLVALYNTASALFLKILSKLTLYEMTLLRNAFIHLSIPSLCLIR